MPRPRLRPVVWQPPPVPARAKATTGNQPLPPLRLLPVGGVGPEDVVVDADGHVVTGLADGRIVRVDPDSGARTVIADTGGRPLGIEVLDDGRLLVCDSHRGLLHVNPADGGIEVVLAELNGRPLMLCSNAVVTPDGTRYVSESSQRFHVEHWRADIMEHSGTGRLLRLAPGEPPEVVLHGLQFANGVTLAPDGSFLLVAETGSYRVTRLWLTGPAAGSSDVFVDTLPGFPDNISTGADGLIWISLPSPRNPALDALHRRHPLLRRLTWSLPEALQPPPHRTVWVMAFDPAGSLVHDIQGSHPDFAMVTSVWRHGDRLILGSLEATAIAVAELS